MSSIEELNCKCKFRSKRTNFNVSQPSIHGNFWSCFISISPLVLDCYKSSCTIWQLDNLWSKIWIDSMKGHRLFNLQINWLLQCRMQNHISINWNQCLVNLLKKMCMSTLEKNSSCPRFSYYEFTASVCWAGVMIMHRTTRWYTKLVLTTGLLVDSLPPDHHIYHTTHITQNS